MDLELVLIWIGMMVMGIIMSLLFGLGGLFGVLLWLACGILAIVLYPIRRRRHHTTQFSRSVTASMTLLGPIALIAFVWGYFIYDRRHPSTSS